MDLSGIFRKPVPAPDTAPRKIQDRYWPLLSLTLQIAAIGCVLIPFIRFNNLLEWDFPGHYAAIWYIREHLFPWFSGWNGYFYEGYPQGTFYPPLAHYLAALLSYPLGIAAAMKLLISLSLLAMPAIFYRFCRRWSLDIRQSAVASAFMTAILFLWGESMGPANFGSDIKSILNVGLFANAVSLPVLFLFMAACGPGDTGAANPSRPLPWKMPAFLLGLLILIHPLATLIAGLFWLALVIGQLPGKPEERQLLSLGKIMGGGLLIGAAWALPFIAWRSYMNPEGIPPLWTPQLELLVFNGVILALSHYTRRALRPLTVCFIVLVNFILLGTLVEIDLQFMRLTIYLLFLIPVFLAAWLRQRSAQVVVILVAIFIAIFGYTHSGIHPAGVPDFPMPDFGRVQGRILSVAPFSHLPGPHVHHNLIPLRTGNESILGLFIESGINGKYMGALTRMIDRQAHVWGVGTDYLPYDALKSEHARYVKDRLRLFGINYIYTDLKLELILGADLASNKRYINSYRLPAAADTPETRAQLEHYYHVRNNQLDFYLYKIGRNAIAEALSYVPPHLTSDWKTTTTLWFMQTQGVPIFTNQSPPPAVRGARGNERVEVISRAPGLDRLELQVHADANVPVLVRIGYFPNWHLTIDGKAAPIYRASPDLMLFFGKGHVVLTYQRSWLEYTGLFLSLLGLALLFIRRKPQHSQRDRESTTAAPESVRAE